MAVMYKVLFEEDGKLYSQCAPGKYRLEYIPGIPVEAIEGTRGLFVYGTREQALFDQSNRNSNARVYECIVRHSEPIYHCAMIVDDNEIDKWYKGLSMSIQCPEGTHVVPSLFLSKRIDNKDLV